MPTEYSEWPQTVKVDECYADQRCSECGADGVCDVCDTIDGRNIECVAEYASTCDGCGELAMHQAMTMDPVTQLGLCEECENANREA